MLEDLNEGRLPLEDAEMTPEIAWVRYRNQEEFENVVYSQFKARLKDHREQTKKKKAGDLKKKRDPEGKSKDPKKKDYIDWRSKEAFKAKNKIIEDLVQGILPLEESEMSAEDAWILLYENEEGFEDVVFRQFKERLKAHRKQVKGTLGRSKFEEECLRHDRMLFPREEVDDDGVPFFDLHPAKQLLEEDVAINKHKQMSPKELRQTREEYMVFSNDYFRARIYQAVRREKFLNYLNYAREIKGKLMRCKPRIDNEDEIKRLREEVFAVRRKKQEEKVEVH